MIDSDIEGSELGTEQFDAFFAVASRLSVDVECAHPDLIEYDKYFSSICELLLPYNHAVFQDLASILSEGLNKIINENRPLIDSECVFLKRIPEILSEYAFIPESKIPDLHLLNHFKNESWVRPVNTHEEKALLHHLLDKTNKSVDSDVQVDEEVSEILEITNQQYNDKCDIDISEISADLDASISNFEASVNRLDENHNTYDCGTQADKEVSEILEVSNQQYNDPSEIDILEISAELDVSTSNFETSVNRFDENHNTDEHVAQADEETSETLEVSNQQYNDNSDIDISELEAELDLSINDLAAVINDDVNDPKTGLSESLEELSEVDDAEGEFNIEDALEISRFYEEDSELETHDFESELSLDDLVADDVDSFTHEDTANTGDLAEEYVSDEQQTIEINAEQKELIALIAEELIEFNQDKESILVDAGKNTEDFKSNLLSIADQTENIRNAIGIIGLEGLSNVTDFVSKNIHALATNDTALTSDQVTMLGQWADYILSYLNDIANKQVCAEILRFIKKPLWPEHMENGVSESLEQLLLRPQLKEEEREVRKNIASPEDMSLVLPDDVNPELLEGLLQDLPVQTGEFSVAIHNLYDQHNIEYLEIAQRIAHTLKGAGNVVGVKGIANLTHNLEDILEIQFKANQIPAGELLEVLIDAADCLETMSEALLGIDEPPDNAQSVYQSVLDWANKLDADGATCLDLALAKPEDIKLVGSEEKNDVKEISSVVKTPLNIENMLRVPAKLADDLLRLAGENLISTSQIQEYIKIIQVRYKNLKLQDQSLQKFSYDLEHIVDVQGISNSGAINNVNNDGFDPLELDQFHELHSMSRRLVELAADSIELTQILEKDFLELQNLVVNQGQLQKENEQLVLRTRMVPISTIVPRLKRGVKQASRLTGKSVDLHVEDNDTYMDSEVLNSLIEPLMHILRNSVGHGIEETQERQQRGKVNHGQINLIFLQRGDQIVIKITDDGRGLSLSEIKNKAISLGLVKSENEVTEINLQNFILRPGFSTRSEVNQMSGRGIGLDVVNSKIRELKGSIEIHSAEGQGCQFLLTLPISSFSVHSLLVRVRENIYAFSNRGIEEILYSGLGELQKVGHETMFKLEDQYYNISMIESLLSLPEDRREGDRDNRPVILVKDDTASHTAILVQDVIDSRDVVVKSMGAYIPKIPGIIGATVLGDGSVVPVIDLPELMQSRQVMDNTSTEEHIVLHKEKKLPYVLVVDDSLSARKSLAQFVEDLGLQVRTARDGMEAVSLIDARKPDLILLDMEMPRMNGLELTGHIRASSITQDMPVIMITSRSTDKHRKAAMDKGVDHYMVKPFAEDELASQINSALKTA